MMISLLLGIFLTLGSPFVVPILVSTYILATYEHTRFTRLTVLLTLEPLLTVCLVAWTATLLPTADRGGLSIPAAFVATTPAILITLILVAWFDDVVFQSLARGRAWFLLMLDALRWGNTFVIFILPSLENVITLTVLLILLMGVVMPSVFAIMAFIMVTGYEGAKRKKKKRKEYRHSAPASGKI